MHSFMLLYCDYETMQPCKVENAVIWFLYFSTGNEAMDNKSNTPAQCFYFLLKKRKPKTPTTTDHASGRALPLRLQFQAKLEESAKALWNTATVEYQRSLL